ncbi:TPA: SpvB/TcaC N-terminal domain-containing protein [Salmonella enterica]
MQSSDTLALSAPTLPKGGGALTGLSGTVGAAAPDGAATFSVPLPVSAGRGYAPPLTLGYSSQAGNGPFGMGWSVSLPTIRRRTRMGAPLYTRDAETLLPDDEFLAPDGEVLVPVVAEDGQVAVPRNILLGTTLDATYDVITWRTRVEQSFSRYEYWQPSGEAGASGAADFWVMVSPDGQAYLLGYETSARVSNPTDTTQTAQWLLNASVSATGEQIYYRWQAEDGTGCTDEEVAAHSDATAQRYLTQVHYGNMTAGRTFPCLNGADVLAAGWLFVLILDYGERSDALTDVPPFTPGAAWTCRQDIFSDYKYGFEVRTRRLCHQVLMFHRLKTLAGEMDAGAEGTDEPVLVSRLVMTYDESPYVTTLTAVRQMAFEQDADQTLLSLPPLEFGWEKPALPGQGDWQTVDAGNLNAQQPWQYVDLPGEGLSGLLYRDAGAWWYRPPVRRDDPDNVNAMTWGECLPLPALPALQGSATLTDLSGDGRLQWVVSAPGVRGHYDQDVDHPGQWLHFTPLSALPAEYAHPRAQLADLTGSGFADLVMVGPRSVRLYAGTGDAWQSGETVLQSGDITLPVPGADPATLVAFSDLLGSGQQHLVEIRADGVTCWPNLGHGRFDRPVMLAGFSQPAATFNPDQVFLADTDGSGTPDIIYAHADHIEVYRNHCGNGFDAPVSIPLPDGVTYDRTCQLQVADVQGLGVATILLSVPHMAPHHYALNFGTDKPWLLNEVNNNMGRHQTLHYRSSAQFWLDEKAEAVAAGQAVPGCYLPFPVHTLWRTTTEDDITGNRLVSEVCYRHGVWDGREREFRGFGFLTVTDTDMVAATATAETLAAPSLTKSWYATGVNAVDERMRRAWWSGDDGAFPAFIPRYTTGHGDDEVALTDETARTQAFWLNRAMKGMPLRAEVYGLDGSEQANVPYSVTEQRLQVRLVNTDGATPVVWPFATENRTYRYERVTTDPFCSQGITLSTDAYGHPLRLADVNYPRRLQPTANPYPDTLPETLPDSSYDPQQQVLYITVSRQAWHHLEDLASGVLMTGLADATRHDVFSAGSDQVPVDGLTLEALSGADSLIADDKPCELAGQQQTYWLNADDTPATTMPAFPPRQAFTDSAALDEERVRKLAALYPNMDLTAILTAAGYQQADYLFARPDEQESRLWIARSGQASFGTASQFWLPQTWRDSPLTGWQRVTRDRYHCVIVQHQDAAGLTISAEYDWRFLTPVRLADVNDNTHYILTDALGRVRAVWFSGTENGAAVGFSGPVGFSLPGSADEAITLSGPLPVARWYVYVTDGLMQDDGPRLPPHVVALTADRYDGDLDQQIRQQVTFSDGFGRVLQTATRQAPGDAWQRTDGGGLVTSGDGTPQAAPTDFRWAVSGKTEYDNKGQPVRTYQPYFLNSWKYVSDDSARQDLHADIHYYDPVGREYQVQTAKGGLRRNLYTPWFVVSEDENDTAEETR